MPHAVRLDHRGALFIPTLRTENLLGTRCSKPLDLSQAATQHDDDYAHCTHFAGCTFRMNDSLAALSDVEPREAVMFTV